MWSVVDRNVVVRHITVHALLPTYRLVLLRYWNRWLGSELGVCWTVCGCFLLSFQADKETVPLPSASLTIMSVVTFREHCYLELIFT
jgi:hypothetical protein